MVSDSLAENEPIEVEQLGVTHHLQTVAVVAVISGRVTTLGGRHLTSLADSLLQKHWLAGLIAAFASFLSRVDDCAVRLGGMAL
jgi:hypothetical protein